MLERILKTSLQSAGKSQEANEIISAIQEHNIMAQESSINSSEEVANALYDKHGFYHRNLEPITKQVNKKTGV